LLPGPEVPVYKQFQYLFFLHDSNDMTRLYKVYLCIGKFGAIVNFSIGKFLVHLQSPISLERQQLMIS
jgi:hypothetical protein